MSKPTVIAEALDCPARPPFVPWDEALSGSGSVRLARHLLGTGVECDREGRGTAAGAWS
jgi:hypothetical protein